MTRSLLSRVGDIAFLLVALFLAFLSAYPIFGTGYYLVVVVAVGLGVGATIAWLCSRAKLGTWPTLGIGLGAYLLLGVPVAAPEVFSAPATVFQRLLGVLVAPVAGPAQILSLTPPLGTYHQVLAPFFFMAIFGSVGALWLAWKPRAPWALAAALPLVPLVAGIALGSPSPSGYGSWSPWAERAVLGGAVVAVTFAWLFWRPWRENRAAVQLTEGTRRRWLAVRGTRAILGVVMVALAGAGSTFLSPHLVGSDTRWTLRDDHPEALLRAAEISPLATYRGYFSNALLNAPLFVVEGTAPTDRIRLATLDYYDGHVFGVIDPSTGLVSDTFAPLPAPLRPAGAEGDSASATVRIDEYVGPWVPLPGQLGAVEFLGKGRTAYQDDFYYQRNTGTGLIVSDAGLGSGTEYRVHSWDTLAPTSAVATFEPGGAEVSLVTSLPDPIAKWIDDQDQPRTGSGLLELVDRLRQRGYLSHSLSKEDGSSPFAWVGELPEYVFEPSRGGHSLDRITRLFERLNEQAEAAAAGGLGETEEALVAAPGDDEQFAVAAALIADYFGFNTRIAVGARLGAQEDARLTFCAEETCTGADMAVWIEVQDGQDGSWAPIDVTPQYELPMSPRIKRTSDPKYATEVAPLGAEVVPPPQAKPSGGSSETNPDKEASSAATETPPALRIVGIVGLSLVALLVLPGTVLLAKTVRAYRRRRAPGSRRQVIGAWDEYTDRARDYRYATPPAATRRETAEYLAFENDSAVSLADWADYVSFQPEGGEEYDSAAAWRLSGLARDNLDEGATWWQRVVARVSVRSFLSRRAFSSRRAFLSRRGG